jgi:beta-phosphoglucomutase-like phosphatase (HAD superfamily)
VVESFAAVIFDFNGVLLWDNALQDASWRAFSTRVRGTPLSAGEMARHVHGRNNRYTLEYLAGAPLSRAESARLSEEKEQTYRAMCLALGDRFHLAPGAEDLLDFLVARAIPRTIATGSGKQNVDFFIERLHLGRWFDLAHIVYDDGTIAGKPAPDLYLAAAARLGIDPARCIVIEDSWSGMVAAQAAGIGRIYALLGDSGHARQETLPESVQVIDDLGAFDRSLLDGAGLPDGSAQP